MQTTILFHIFIIVIIITESFNHIPLSSLIVIVTRSSVKTFHSTSPNFYTVCVCHGDESNGFDGLYYTLRLRFSLESENSKAAKVLSLYTVDLDLIPSIPYGLLSTSRRNSWEQSQETPLSIIYSRPKTTHICIHTQTYTYILYI